MYSNVVLNAFNRPQNTGRISKPDGIADNYNEDQTSHVEFSLRIESGIITDCKFRAQANPYIIAICSTITSMVKGKMLATVFLDPFSVKDKLGDHSETDIMFCIDCVRLAIQDYREKLEKDNKAVVSVEKQEVETVNPTESPADINAEDNNVEEVEKEDNILVPEDFLDFEDDLTDEDFGFFDFEDEE